MAAYRRILVATDGSGPAGRAVERGLMLARWCQAELVIVAIIHLPLSYRLALGSALAMREEPWVTLRRQAEEILAAAGRRSQEQGQAVTAVLRWGEPAEEILQLAQEPDCDLLVLGSRGLGQARAHLLGSVSDRLSHEFQRDLLIVH